MKPRIIFVINIVLALVAVLLGYLIYQQQTGTTLFTVGNPSPPNLLIPPSGDPSAPLARIDVLNWPTPDASAQEKQRHADLVQSLAEKTEYVDIVNCVAQPLVAQIEFGQTFSFRNQDAVDHTITIREGAEFSISTGDTAKRIADTNTFKLGPGNYGYVCDSQTGITGIFFVVE